MHQPRPHGQFGAASEEDAAAAEQLARRLSNFKAVSGLDSLKLTRTLPSGAMAIAVDAGGVLRVIIQQPDIPKPQRLDSDGLAKSFIPMMFSGVVVNGRPPKGQGVRLRLSPDTRKRLGNYKSMGAPEYVSLKRFVVNIPQQLAEFMPQYPTDNYEDTQYMSCRPTWWSGLMAAVVQIVGGYGRQDRDALPEDALERARMAIPESVAKKIAQELGNKRLPGYSGFPPKDGQFAFDYKFNSTHGVGLDDQRRPWLLRVSPAGVYAMPLPLISATTTKAFRIYVTEQGDNELLWALDNFGGLPSGEGFPKQTKDFEAWRRAGVIIKVCEAGSFYQHFAYSTAMGWAFNGRGTEAANTVYRVAEGTGLSYGLMFKLSLRLGSARADGLLPEEFHLDSDEEQAQLNAYLSRLYAQLGANDASALAIKYKLRLVGVQEVLGRATLALRTGHSIEREVEYWDNLEAGPIAAHSGSITQVSQGPLPWRLAGFKVPEPFMQGCISFEAPEKPKVDVPKCDTVVAAYYTGNTLKVIKYFKDERKYKQDVQDNYDPCMIVGSWRRITTDGQTGLQGEFYTSDFDDRQAIADTVTVTDTVGKDLGYDHTPWFSYDEWFWRPGTIWRNRYFQHNVKSVTTNNKVISLAVCMPFFDRNAVLYAKQESVAGTTTNESVGLYSIRDPYSYRYWTHDNIMAWIGGVSGPQAAVPVYPKDGNPVWVVQENYAPSLCSDFADQGPWISLPADYTWLVHPNKNVWAFNGGGGAPKVKEGSTSKTEPAKTEKLLQVSTLEQTARVHTNPANTYWLFSPDPYVGMFYRDAVKVAAGEAEYANVSEEHPQRQGERFYQGWCSLADNKGAHHFIGVIND